MAPITIDGKADESAWRMRGDRSVHDAMAGEGQAAAQRYVARLLWDKENLYFFAEMDDPDLYSAITEHNSHIWENDCFELSSSRRWTSRRITSLR